jgi:TnpA family transposase
MTNTNNRLTILSDAERYALYGLPDFDDGQRLEYLTLSPQELALASSRVGLHVQIYFTLQIGYFKAKNAFFSFTWEEVREDTEFALLRYFNGQIFEPLAITKHEHYTQRAMISRFFGFQLWSAGFLEQLKQQAASIVTRDISPGFVAAELIIYLNEHEIVRPRYTTLQKLISKALVVERSRLGRQLAEVLDSSTRTKLSQLLVHEDTLSELAALKQDAKNFGWRQMVREREKRAKLETIYQIAKNLLPSLAISKQNILYYASLANFYSVYDLRRLKAGQAHLYLLCYAWQRYQQLTDNLVDAMSYHMKKFEDETKLKANKMFLEEQAKRQQETLKVGRLLLLYVDEAVDDSTTFGDVRRKAFKIMPREALQFTGKRLSTKSTTKLALQWRAVDKTSARIRRHLRPIYGTLHFSGRKADSPWLAALNWMNHVFSKHQRLSQRPLRECPSATIPKRLRPYLLVFDENGISKGVNADRYEFWVYRQLRKRLKSGEIYLNDSLQHRCFNDDLVHLDDKKDILKKMDIPWLRQSADNQIKVLAHELHNQWAAFNQELSQGKLKHLDYDKTTEKLTWRRTKNNDRAVDQDSFYKQLPFCDVTDVFRFVDKQCQFLSALTPLQPRYAKNNTSGDSQIAAIAAQAMNHGNLVMAKTSDIQYHTLETTYQQYLRQASLIEANDRISNAIASLAIFPHYSFDLGMLYGSVDGQKFSVEQPTVKARHSRKYFGRGRGVVAYSLMCNHVPLLGWLIGANEYEAHHVFDIWYRNTSDIIPTIITGDMHSINKANFAILHWFGLRFEPRFSKLGGQLKELYCIEDPSVYKKYLIQPVGQIDIQTITNEKSNIDQIVATLGLKEMTQGTLIRKLCTYTQPNPTRQAIFEFDKIIRSIYTLRYLRDPQIQRNVHRSQNRIESYHQLRSAIAKVGGKKELTGRTDIEIEISNQCARLVANSIIYFNSAILSRLLINYEGMQNHKMISMIKKISPVAWQHILLGGHYTFQSSGHPLNLDEIIKDLEWE